VDTGNFISVEGHYVIMVVTASVLARVASSVDIDKQPEVNGHEVVVCIADGLREPVHWLNINGTKRHENASTYKAGFKSDHLPTAWPVMARVSPMIPPQRPARHHIQQYGNRQSKSTDPLPVPGPMGDCCTFREELAVKYPKFGHALWEPDPGGLYHSVEVGDVGLIRSGRFDRLFNALLPRDHPSNLGSYDGPNYPQQLQPRTPNHINRSKDYQKEFRSKSVTKEVHGPNVFASG